MIRFAVAILAVLAVGSVLNDVGAAEAKVAPKIVLIAGPLDSHPKETHEYERCVILLKHCLETASNLPKLRVEAHFNGWPADPTTLDDASTIVLISGGSDRMETDHPLYVGDRLEQLAKQMKRGCGLAQIHWSTFNPSRFHDQITEWVGGYFDYETGPAPQKWFSAIETKQWRAIPADEAHPVCRGVKPFELTEEFYYKIKFRDGDKRLKPLLYALAREGDSLDNQARGDTALDTVAWGVERENGARGFGFTGGHFFRNWWIPEFRKFALNAIVWTAGVEVPEGGVETALEPPIRTLILTGNNHPAHDWAKVTDALVRVLEHEPRIALAATTDPERTLAEADLSQYDVFVLNYCNWERPGLGETAKQKFVERLKAGAGLSIVHFANGAFNKTLPGAPADNDWDEYRTKIVRRVWMHGDSEFGSGSGHDAFGEFRVDIPEGDHPIVAGLESFPTVDELYFNQRGPLPIEPLATAHSRVTGKDEPMAWAYEYEKSRVFQTVLGHAAESVVAAGALIRRGTIWSAGAAPLSFDPPLEIVGRAPAWREKQAAAPAPPDDSKVAAKKPPPKPKIEGHWGEDAVGVRWTEDDSRDNRLAEMDTGRFYSGTILVGERITNKALAIRLGDKQQASICYDTDILKASGAWTGRFLKHDAARYGLIVPPIADGPMIAATKDNLGWAGPDANWKDPRSKPFGPLPHGWGRYRGMYRHGQRVVLQYRFGETEVLETPWIEERENVLAVTRTFLLGPGDAPLSCRLADAPADSKAKREALGRGKRMLSLVSGDKALAAALVSADPAGSIEPRDGGIVFEAPPRSRPLAVKLILWSGAVDDFASFKALVEASPPPEDVAALTAPDEPQWTIEPITRGVVAPSDKPYVVDTLAPPFDNPYKALMFLSGHDFLSNGEAAVCTAHGDVWLVSGIDDKLEKLTWKRFATGLFQPLGLKVVEDKIYVCCRDQIARLHDRNGDREADWYETFNNDGQVSDNGHEYATCLETDSQGNFYYLRGDSFSKTDHDGCLLRVSPDGAKHEVFATGFRNANGMGIGPGDVITVSPQEGEWTPNSAIFQVEQGGFYGCMHIHHRETPPTDYDRPLCWLPRRMDNSSGGQIWAPSPVARPMTATGAGLNVPWGPLSGHMLHLAYGRCKLMMVMEQPLSSLAGQPHLPPAQAAVVELPLDFSSGVMRGRFNPHDGQLYVTGLRGWVTNAAQDGCLERVRYTGVEACAPIGWKVLENGVRIDFSRALDEEAAEDPGNYSVEGWNYLWSEAYGSDEYLAHDPRLRGRDEFDVLSAQRLGNPEGPFRGNCRSVFLEIPNLKPMMQINIRMDLASWDKKPLSYTLAGTIHELGAERIEPERPAKPRPGVLSESERAALRPGWTLTYEKASDGKTHRDVLPTTWAANVSPNTGKCRAAGHLKTALKGDFTFRLLGAGAARLVINDEEVLAAEGDLASAGAKTVKLFKGYNRVKLDYEPPASGDASWRVEWSGEGFAFEPLPRAALFHDGAAPELVASERRRDGQEAFAELGCARCHASAEADGEHLFAAPSLAETPSRLTPKWLAAWILDPQKFRRGSPMPNVLAADEATARQQAADLAVWLASQAGAESASPESDEQLLEKGLVIYENLGCIACHRFTPDEQADDYDRLSLASVAAKYTPAGLSQYLAKPHAFRPATTMPDFRLNEEENAALTAYLLDAAEGEVESLPELAAADAERGGKLFTTLGCRQCHGTEKPTEKPASREPIAKSLAGADLSRGCLADNRSPPIPRFAIDEEKRAALVEFLKAESPGDAMAVDPARLFTRLRCGACHDRDGVRSPRPDILAEDGEQGIVPEALPDLTHAGEKLHRQWIADFLGGKIEYRPRPWLNGRMPAFPAYSERLADAFVARHAPPEAASDSPTPSEATVNAGQLLTRKEGLDCRQCHGLGREQPTSDKDAKLALGINFSHVPARVRKPFYDRWMLDPLRIDPLTKMPKFAFDGEHTKAPQILEGDAQAQFEAIWEYLRMQQ